MKPGFRAVIVALMSAGTAMAAGQQKTEKPPNPVYLELSAEVATTTDDGYPAALRITVKNVGNVAVDMPIPISPCLVAAGELRFTISGIPITRKFPHLHQRVGLAGGPIFRA